jgi:ATP-dependent RNA helicase RhlE
MNNFSEISLSAPLRSNLLKHGYSKPTPVQALAIAPALAGSDVVATAQTGTGKTLAFVLPIVQTIGGLIGKQPAPSGILAVILSPTRELALQTQETFGKMAMGTGVRAAIAIGGLNERPQLASIRKGAQVLIATPGRLYDFLSRQLVDLSGVRMLILDEADRMLDLGFLPTIKRLMAAMPADRQTLFFSATIETSVKHLVETHVRNAVRIEVGSISKPIEKVELHLYEVEQDRKLGLLSRMLREEAGSFLVFARTKHGSDKLSKKLAREGVKTAVIHGNRSQNQRSQALSGFQTGYYRVLVATDIAARGIHVEGISHVVNYDLPQVPEDFIHRIGRTGRAGAHGKASTFATRSERADIARIERALTTRLERRPVPSDILREEKQTAPVIVLPSTGPRPQHVQPHVRSFGPRSRSGRRPARRVI